MMPGRSILLLIAAALTFAPGAVADPLPEGAAAPTAPDLPALPDKAQPPPVMDQHDVPPVVPKEEQPTTPPAAQSEAEKPPAEPAAPFEKAADAPKNVQPVAPSEAFAILGKKVHGPDGKDILGSVIDILVDGQGHPRAAIVDFGGFLGVGSRKIAVDWELMKFNPTDPAAQIVLDLDRSQIQAAPEYKDATQPAEVVEPALVGVTATPLLPAVVAAPSIPPGAIPPGAIPPGAIPPGAIPPGAAPPETTTQSDTSRPADAPVPVPSPPPPGSVAAPAPPHPDAAAQPDADKHAN